MIRSMTAFASGERATPWGTLGCELRSVNHRFLELGVRLADELRVLEPALRERIGARIGRGKLDLTLRLRPPEGGDALQLRPSRLR
ncbi:YicC/YloC family endoribonuclease, partial [Lysobacter sp. 2RAB21]